MQDRTTSDPRQRVVITGLGVVAPNGVGRDAFWEAVTTGRSGVDYIRSFDPEGIYCKIAGEVRDFVAEDWMDAREARRMGRFSQFAVAAAAMAMQDAQLTAEQVEPYRAGAVFGTSLAGNGNIADDIYEHLDKDLPAEALEITAATQVAAHAATSYVCIENGFKGPNTTSGVGCASALDSMSTAMSFVRSGQADVMIAGGTEACISRVGMGLLARMRVLTHYNDPPQLACRPYDNTRDGLVLSEGAAAVVLETADHAMQRGAPIYAEILAYGSATESFHLIAAVPHGEELAQALRFAMMQGRVGPEDIDYVCAHGIGNRQYDVAETNALKMVLGKRAYHVPISSIKGATGQPFAAGGGWQTVAACLTIQQGLIPPTMNYRVPDPECDLDYVPNKARRARVDTVVLNSHSFGGTHACLLLRRYAEDN